MTGSEITTVPDRSIVLAAMRSAGRAPSVHNTQPWTWVLNSRGLRLYRDDRRLLEVADPSGRQLVISCGAMLHHVRTAFAAIGWHTDTVRMPDPARPDLLAAIEFRRWPDPPPGVLARAEAMARRFTDRMPMRPPEDWDTLLHRLRLIVSPHDVEVDVLDESVRPRLATATEQTAALQRYDMRYQAELHWWIGHSRPSDGVSMDGPGAGGSTAIGRSFPAARPVREPDEDRARVVVLGTYGDTDADWLRVGEALSGVLLECTAAGQATCALTHLTEVAATRKLLARLTQHPHDPQVVIRIGADDHRYAFPKTPRRPVTEYLTVEAGGSG